MKKILIAHLVTEAVEADFLAAQRWQRIFAHAVEGLERVVIAKKQPRGCRLKLIYGGQMFLRDRYNLAAHRNLALDYALYIGADWVIPLDADYVILQAPKVLPDREGWAFPLSIWDEPESTSFPPASIHALTAPTAAAPMEGDLSPGNVRRSSSLLLGREIFESYTYDEFFNGYYYEDNAFEFNLWHKDGRPPGYTDAVLLHRWHPKRIEVPEANRRRFSSLRRGFKKQSLHAIQRLP